MIESVQMTTEVVQGCRRVVFLPGNPYDAETARAVLDGFDIRVCPVDTLSALVEEARQGAGCLLIAEERLQSPEVDDFIAFLDQQPEWSDLPVLISTHKGSPSERAWRLTEFANATLIERPLEIKPLVSLIRSALRDRHRQYEIRQSIANRDFFLAMVGHELRNPLTAISLAANMLDGAEGRVVDIIKRQTRRLEHVVNDLYEVSQIRRGKLSFDCARQDLVGLVRSTLESFEPIASDHNLTLTVELPDDPVWVDGDVGRLGQVIGNLVSNAIRYTPRGGRIDVEARRRGTLAVITVADTGIGIPADKLEGIFDLFSTAHQGSEASAEGLGLGLNLAYNIVQAHGGELVAESAGEGKGAKFSIFLPAADPPNA